MATFDEIINNLVNEMNAIDERNGGYMGEFVLTNALLQYLGMESTELVMIKDHPSTYWGKIKEAKDELEKKKAAKKTKEAQTTKMTVTDGFNKLRLKYDPITEEWMVVFIENGKRIESKTYYTSDKQDAIDTLTATAKQYGII